MRSKIALFALLLCVIFSNTCQKAVKENLPRGNFYKSFRKIKMDVIVSQVLNSPELKNEESVLMGIAKDSEPQKIKFRTGFYIGVIKNILAIHEPGDSAINEFFAHITYENKKIAVFTLDSCVEKLTGLDKDGELKEFFEIVKKYVDGNIEGNELDSFSVFIKDTIDKNNQVTLGYKFGIIYSCVTLLSIPSKLPLDVLVQADAGVRNTVENYLFPADSLDEYSNKLIKLTRETYFSGKTEDFVSSIILAILYNFDIDINAVQI